MANEGAKKYCPPVLQEFDVESLPIPPGTKSRARLSRGPEDEPSPWRIRWALGGVAVVAFLAGVAVGRYLLS